MLLLFLLELFQVLQDAVTQATPTRKSRDGLPYFDFCYPCHRHCYFFVSMSLLSSSSLSVVLIFLVFVVLQLCCPFLFLDSHLVVVPFLQVSLLATWPHCCAHGSCCRRSNNFMIDCSCTGGPSSCHSYGICNDTRFVTNY